MGMPMGMPGRLPMPMPMPMPMIMVVVVVMCVIVAMPMIMPGMIMGLVRLVGHAGGLRRGAILVPRHRTHATQAASTTRINPSITLN